MAKPTAPKAKTTRKPTGPKNAPTPIKGVEGMQEVTTEYNDLPQWDFAKKPRFEGTVTRVSDFLHTKSKFGERETRVMHIADSNGEEFSLWESAGLKDLFENAVVGTAVVIVAQGKQEFSDGRTMNTFRCFMRRD